MAATADDNVTMAGNLTYAEAFPMLRSMEDEEALQMVVVYLYLALVIALGLPGNLLVSVVYITKFKASTTRYFIVTLAILDLLNCMLAIPVEFVDLYRSYTYPDVVLCKVHAIVTAFSSIGSALVLVVVARDRYWKICRPLARQLQARQARHACLGCALAAILAAWPCALLYGVERVDTGLAHVTGRRCSSDEQFVHTVFPLLYGCVLLLLFLGSILALATLYALLCRRMFKQETMYSTSRKPKREKKPSSIFYRSNDPEESKETTNSCSLASEDQSEDWSSTDPPSRNTPALNAGLDTSDANDDSEDFDSVVSPQTDDKLCKRPGVKARNVSFQKDLTPDGSHSHDLIRQLRNAGESTTVPEENGSTRGRGCFGSVENRLDQSLKIGDSGIDSGQELSKDDSVSALPKEETPGKLTLTPLRPLISAKKRSRRRRAMASRKTTVTLFLVTLIYVLSYLPYLIIGVMHALKKSLFEDLEGGSLVVYALFVRLFYVQSAVNPFIYGLRNPQFRAKSLSLLHCKKRRWRLPSFYSMRARGK